MNNKLNIKSTFDSKASRKLTTDDEQIIRREAASWSFLPEKKRHRAATHTIDLLAEIDRLRNAGNADETHKLANNILANAHLLEGQVRKDMIALAEAVIRLHARVSELEGWVNDLQSGMYINCVYCGHRYGPKESTPATAAEILKMHVERCPKHPMSALKTRLAAAEKREAALKQYLRQVANDLIAEDFTRAQRFTRANEIEQFVDTFADYTDKSKSKIKED
jgi:DNA-directed RNA polymerase subunit RPC12/RpoP